MKLCGHWWQLIWHVLHVQYFGKFLQYWDKSEYCRMRKTQNNLKIILKSRKKQNCWKNTKNFGFLNKFYFCSISIRISNLENLLSIIMWTIFCCNMFSKIFSIFINQFFPLLCHICITFFCSLKNILTLSPFTFEYWCNIPAKPKLLPLFLGYFCYFGTNLKIFWLLQQLMGIYKKCIESLIQILRKKKKIQITNPRLLEKKIKF